MYFSGLNIAFDHPFDSNYRSALSRTIKEHGGIVYPCITKSVALVVTTQKKIVNAHDLKHKPTFINPTYIETCVTNSTKLSHLQFVVPIEGNNTQQKKNHCVCPKCGWPGQLPTPTTKIAEPASTDTYKPTPSPRVPTPSVTTTTTNTHPISPLNDEPSVVTPSFTSGPLEANNVDTVLALQKTFFDEMDVPDSLLRGIYAYGLETASTAQQQIIPTIQTGQDCIFQFPSGTGKTTACVIGVLSRLNFTSTDCQALILTATRELAQQTHQLCVELGTYIQLDNNNNNHHHHHTGWVRCCVGGVSPVEDERALTAKNHPVLLVVGTGGRVSDLINRQALHPNHIKTILLDELDELMCHSKLQTTANLLNSLSTETQIIGCCTNQPYFMIPNKLHTQYCCVTVPNHELLHNKEEVKQYYVLVEEHSKVDTVLDLHDHLFGWKTIIFCNTRRKIDWLSDQLLEHDIHTTKLHSGLTIQERENALTQFKAKHEGDIMLIASEDMLKGISIPKLSVVLGFDLPTSKEGWIHRCGRVGQFGRKGVCIDFVTSNCISTVKELEAAFSVQWKELPMDFAEGLTA